MRQTSPESLQNNDGFGTLQLQRAAPIRDGRGLAGRKNDAPTIALGEVTHEQHVLSGNLPLAFGRSNLKVNNLGSVLLLEGARNMYCPTPALGIDKVAQLCSQQLPKEVAIYTVVLGYEDRNRTSVIRIDRNGHDASQEVSATTLFDLISQIKPGLIGVGGTSKEAGVLLDLLRSSGADLSGSMVMCGGIHASVASLSLLQQFGGRPLDMVVMGRAAETLPSVLQCLQQGDYDRLLRLPHTAAFVRPEEGVSGGFLLTDTDTMISRIDSLAAVQPGLRDALDQRRETILAARASTTEGSRDSVSIARYTAANPLQVSMPDSSSQRLTKWHEEVVVRVQTAEGCQYACTFCAVSALTLRGPSTSAQRYIPYNLSSFAHFLDSLANDRRLHNVPREQLLVYLEDAQVGGRAGSDYDKRARELHSLLSTYPQYRFGYQTRFDTFLGTNEQGERIIRYDLMDQLQRGHVEYLFLSIESLDSSVLRRMAKGQNGNIVEIYEVFKGLRDRGIDYMISFIGGMENEPHGAAHKTAAFIAEVLDPKNIAFEIAKVYPGTPDAALFAARFGIDVGEAYTSGNHTVGYEYQGMPPEEQGCVLQALSPGAAVRLHQQIEDIILTPGRLRSEFRRNFPPLGPGRYRKVADGFYSRALGD